MEQFIKRSRPWRWGLALALLLLGVLGGFLQWFTTCEQKALESGAVKTVCRDPSISDAAVVFAGILFLLLIAPDFEEAGLFGFSLKRRVEQQEKKQQALEGQLSVVAARIETVAAATATASANVYLVTGADVRQARQAIGAKEQQFLQEVATIRRPPEAAAGKYEVPSEVEVEEAVPPPAPEDAELIAQVIRIWEELDQLLQLTPTSRPRSLWDLVKSEVRQRFIERFNDELQVVRAARNAAAHGRPLDRQVLEDAVAVGSRLLAIARRTLS